MGSGLGNLSGATPVPGQPLHPSSSPTQGQPATSPTPQVGLSSLGQLQPQGGASQPLSQRTVAQVPPGSGGAAGVVQDIFHTGREARSYAPLPNLLSREEEQEVYTLFSNFSEKTEGQLVKASLESKRWIARREKFITQVKEATALNSLETQEADRIKIHGSLEKGEEYLRIAKRENLSDYIFRQEGGLNRFTSMEQVYLYQMAFDLGDYESMDAMMTYSKYEDFRISPINMEFLARAALQTEPPNASHAVYIATKLYERFLSPRDEENIGFYQVAEALSLLAAGIGEQIEAAKLYREEVLKAGADPNYTIDEKVTERYNIAGGMNMGTRDPAFFEEEVRLLEKERIAALEKGFFIDYEPARGEMLLEALLEQGDPRAAAEIAKVLQISCRRDGALEFPNPQNAKAELISSCILGEPLTGPQLGFLAHTLQTAQEGVKGGILQGTIRALDALKQTGRYNSAEIDRAISALSAPQGSAPDLGDAIKKLKEKSYNYQGISSNYIGGNFRFGGLLYSSYLNRKDKHLFNELLHRPLGELIDKSRTFSQERIASIETKLKKPLDEVRMADIEDVFIFMEVADLFTRQSFHNEELQMEDLHSSGHKKFEQATSGLFNLAGMAEKEKRKLVDGAGSPVPGSMTNPTVALSIGLGDCRQHAQTKQMLFDEWRKVRINLNLSEGYRKIETQGPANDSLLKAQELAGMDLRTFDVIVKAPIKMKEKYSPELNLDGEHMPTPNGDFCEVEDHTMNILFKSGEVFFADSFYQDHEFYHWGGGRVDLTRFETEGMIPAGKIRVRDERGAEAEVPIVLTPTPYAGKRDKYNQGSGETLLLGVRTDLSNFADHISAKNLALRNDFIDKMHRLG